MSAFVALIRRRPEGTLVLLIKELRKGIRKLNCLGGKIEAKDSFDAREAAAREVKEETGGTLIIELWRLVMLVPYHEKTKASILSTSSVTRNITSWKRKLAVPPLHPVFSSGLRLKT